MKLSELTEGDVFCIGGTRSYPKLKLKKGYIDIKDRIHKPVCPDWDVEVIELQDFRDSFGIDAEKAERLLDGLKKYGG